MTIAKARIAIANRRLKTMNDSSSLKSGRMATALASRTNCPPSCSTDVNAPNASTKTTVANSFLSIFRIKNMSQVAETTPASIFPADSRIPGRISKARKWMTAHPTDFVINFIS